MSWTNTETVKKHLLELDRLSATTRDLPLQLDFNGEALLPRKGILSSSEKVKYIPDAEPAAEDNFLMAAENWSELDYENVVPGELLIAADASLATIYVEGVDYAVDWSGGRARRLPGSGIADGSPVYVAYQRYAVAVLGADYNFDYATGEISALISSDLHADMQIYVDFESSVGADVDQLLDESIAEAEDVIIARLKTGYGGSSTDQGLKTGASNLAASVVCRGLAARALLDGASSAEGRSRGFRELAESFETVAWRVLRPFLAAPVMKAAGKQANNSWEWN